MVRELGLGGVVYCCWIKVGVVIVHFRKRGKRVEGRTGRVVRVLFPGAYGEMVGGGGGGGRKFLYGCIS